MPARAGTLGEGLLMAAVSMSTSVLVRRAARRVLVVGAALGMAAGAYAVGAGHSDAPAPAAPLGAGGLMLAAAQGDGVTLSMTISSPAGTLVQNVPVNSLQWGVGAGVYGGDGRPPEKSQASISEITITHATDASSMTLLDLTKDQSAVDLTAVVTITRPDQHGNPLEQLTFRATGAALSGFSTSVGTGSQQLAYESESIFGSDITVTYAGGSGSTTVAHVGGTQKGSADSQALLRREQAGANSARTGGN